MEKISFALVFSGSTEGFVDPNGNESGNQGSCQRQGVVAVVIAENPLPLVPSQNVIDNPVVGVSIRERVQGVAQSVLRLAQKSDDRSTWDGETTFAVITFVICQLRVVALHQNERPKKEKKILPPTIYL